MVMERAGRPLEPTDLPQPEAGPGQLVVRVRACGVCRTDLHLVDGELPAPKANVVPGHQVVGDVVATGTGVDGFSIGTRVGVPWLARTCGRCRYCLGDHENLCPEARFTGYTVDGGYAEFMGVDARFCLPLPPRDLYGDADLAPLLCAGLIGYRSLRLAGPARRIGFYGFGAAAHILTQVVRHRGGEVYAFTRPGDEAAREFALRLGAAWAGGSDTRPPELLDAAIIFAPAGSLVPTALRAVAPGGIVVCGGIHMSDIPSFPYAWLWEERTLRSVANLTRADGHEFLALAAETPIRTEVTTFRLDHANEALHALRSGKINGSAVLVVS